MIKPGMLVTLCPEVFAPYGESPIPTIALDDIGLVLRVYTHVISREREAELAKILMNGHARTLRCDSLAEVTE